MNQQPQNRLLINGHLALQTLRLFSEGAIGSEMRQVVQVHLKSCKRCQRLLDELNSERAIQYTDDTLRSDSSLDANIESPKAEPGKAKEVAGASSVTGGRSPSPKGSAPIPQPHTKKPESVLDKKLELVPGELLKLTDYQVIKEIGRGAMGVLYLVEHRLTARQEVLKVIHPNLIDRDDVRERFLREIQSAAKLNHPSVVQTLNAIEQGSLLGLVMEYAPGETLAQMVHRIGPIDFDLALRFAIQATEGLVHASQKKMVHRDIKPSNLMITGSKENLSLKILDFGLARSLSESEQASDMTIEGRIIGTPHFMSPEQAMNPSTTDARADIYSLGCSIYFALTGHRPFQGETAIAVLTAHQTESPVPIAHYRQNAPMAFVSVIEKMMAKQKRDRYRSPADLLLALKGLASTQDSDRRSAQAPDNSLSSNRRPIGQPGLFHANDANGNSTGWQLSKKPVKRKKRSSLVGTFLVFLVPPLATLAVLYYLPPWKWDLQSLLSNKPQSSIILRQLPPGAQVLIDGFPANFQRQSADAAPMIPAAPGKYEVTVVFEGREAMKRDVIVQPYERHYLNVEIRLPQPTEPMVSQVQDTLEVIPIVQPSPESIVPPVAPMQPPEVALPQMYPEGVPERDTVVTPEPSNNIDSLLVPAYVATAAFNFEVSEPILSSLEGMQFTGEAQMNLEAFQETHKLLLQYHQTLENALSQLEASQTLTLKRLDPKAPKGPWSDDPIGFQFSDQSPNSVSPEDQVLVKAAIVEASPERLVMRVGGENRAFVPSDFPLTTAAALFRLSPQEPWPQCELTLAAGCLMSSQATTDDRIDALKKLQQAFSKGELPYDLSSNFYRLQNLKLDRSTPIVGQDATPKSIAQSEGLEFKIHGRLIGHQAAVFKGYFLSDGRYVSCQQSAGRVTPLNARGREHSLIVWAKNGLGGIELKRPIPGTVSDFTVSSNGRILALLAQNEQLKNHLEVWTESQKKSILSNDILASNDTRIVFSSLNSSLLAVEGSGRTMRWNLRNQQLTQNATRIDPMGRNMILGTAATDDLDLILHLTDSNNLKVWQSSTGKTIASADLPKTKNSLLRLQGRNKGVFFSLKLDAWVIADVDGSIHVFDKDMKLQGALGDVLESSILISEISLNGQFLALVDSSHRVMLYDLSTRLMLASWSIEVSNNPTCLSIDNTGTKVAIGDSSGEIQLFSQ